MYERGKNNEAFAAALSNWMERERIGAAKLSEILGVSKSAIYNYKNGRVPESSIIVELARLMGTTPDDLLSTRTSQVAESEPTKPGGGPGNGLTVHKVRLLEELRSRGGDPAAASEALERVEPSIMAAGAAARRIAMRHPEKMPALMRLLEGLAAEDAAILDHAIPDKPQEMITPPMLDGTPQASVAFDPAWLARAGVQPENARLFKVQDPDLVTSDGIFSGDMLLVDISACEFSDTTYYVIRLADGPPVVRELSMRGTVLHYGGTYSEPVTRPVGAHARILGIVRARVGVLSAISPTQLRMLDND